MCTSYVSGWRRWTWQCTPAAASGANPQRGPAVPLVPFALIENEARAMQRDGLGWVRLFAAAHERGRQVRDDEDGGEPGRVFARKWGLSTAIEAGTHEAVLFLQTRHGQAKTARG